MRSLRDRAGLATAAGAAFAVLAASAAHAALPPYWQSAREIAAIVGDARVHDALRYEEPILSVSTTGDDVYEVRTTRCVLRVTIVDVPTDPQVMGPRKFDLDIGAAECE